MLFVLSAHGANLVLNPGDDLQTLTGALTPGDEITLNDGVYPIIDPLYWSGLGSEESPIRIIAANPGGATIQRTEGGGGYVAEISDSTFFEVEGIVFAGNPAFADWETDAYYGGLAVYNSSDVAVVDCTMQDLRGTGLRIDGNNTVLMIQRNEIFNVQDGSGISIGNDASAWTQESLIENNLIHDLVSEDTWRVGIGLEDGSQNNQIIDNIIFRVPGTGIYLGSTEFGDPNVVERNAVWDAVENGILVEGSSTVRNNVIFRVDGYGIRSRDDGDGGLYKTVISFNTVAETTDYAARLELWDLVIDGPMVFTNNALSNTTGYGFEYDYDDSSGEPPDASLLENYISGNVVTGLVTGIDTVLFPDWFVAGGGPSDFGDPTNFDFYPTDGSSLVDTADPSGKAWVPELDFNGAERPGDFPDVGAYERDGDANPGWTLREDFKELGVDPSVNSGVDVPTGGCCSKDKKDGKDAWLLLPLLGFFLRRRDDR